LRVSWDGTSLQISEGDEIEILRGIKHADSMRASTIRNRTKGQSFRSDIEGVMMTRMPIDFDPPIVGYAMNIEFSGQGVKFEIEEKASPIVADIYRECKKFLDPMLYERCKDKDYHDVLTNAFPILEDAIRAKLGVGPEYSGSKLINYAFNPNTGKVVLGETKNERQCFYFILAGNMGFLRNPPSHRLTVQTEESSVEAFEITCIVDHLLRLVDRASLRS